MQQLTRAKIVVIDKEAIDESRGLPEEFDVQFNPTEYTMSKSAVIAEIGIPGLDSPLQQYVRGESEKLTLDLFFDETDNGMGESATSVDKRVESFYQLIKIQPKTHALPRIQFVWGEDRSFQAVVESIQRKYTLFSPTGVPLRATLTVSFREYKTLEAQIKEFKLESPDFTKQRMVRRGETLSSIAALEYNDPSYWRLIARKNNLANPRAIRPGMVLAIPPLGETVVED
ncbi:MAG: peptidoglycan-binding protein [Anaerolineaceae bacterium]|nr:peptidoglycan-binding protein [Anaerolineaceae bacterium]